MTKETKSWKRSHSAGFWGGAPLKASHNKGLQDIDTIEVVTTSRAIPNKDLRHAEGAQATEASHNLEKRSFANTQDDALINMSANHNFKKKVAFTLAEVLITLAIIGIVAALTMPTLLKNVAERENSETQANIAQKITKSMDLMRADGGLERTYASTDDFVDELSKYLKISTRCDAAHIANCWPTKTVTTSDGETYDVSKAKTGKNLNLKDNKSDNVGLILADGSSLILTYNPNAGIIGDGDTVTPSFADLPIGFGRTKKFAYTTSVTAPIDFVMDVNGFKGPNSETRNGKQYDIRSFKVAKFSDGCPGKKISGVGCYYKLPSYSPLRTGDSEMAKWDPKWKNGWGDNYWAGAKKACDELGMSLPSFSKLTRIRGQSIKAPDGNYWLSSEWNDFPSFAEIMGLGTGYTTVVSKGNSSINVLCVGD